MNIGFVVTTLGRLDPLRALLTSLEGQLRGGDHVVLVAQGAQDDVAALAAEFSGRGVPVTATTSGRGASLGRNTGVAALPAGDAVVTFGRHGAAKNARAAIDALALLPADSGIEVVYVGDLDPALEPHAAAKGIAPGRIHWLGRVSDDELAEAFARAKAFVWPSLHEGFGLPPLEAQRLGTPVLASDIPINREILGDSARYFPATDAAALAALFTEIARDPSLRADLSRRSLANAEDFTWRRAAERWSALIDARVG